MSPHCYLHLAQHAQPHTATSILLVVLVLTVCCSRFCCDLTSHLSRSMALPAPWRLHLHNLRCTAQIRFQEIVHKTHQKQCNESRTSVNGLLGYCSVKGNIVFSGSVLWHTDFVWEIWSYLKKDPCVIFRGILAEMESNILSMILLVYNFLNIRIIVFVTSSLPCFYSSSEQMNQTLALERAFRNRNSNLFYIVLPAVLLLGPPILLEYYSFPNIAWYLLAHNLKLELLALTYQEMLSWSNH